MHENDIYLTAIVDTGATQFASEYLRRFNLSQLTEVRVAPMPYDSVEVTFFFETSPRMFEMITVRNAFCVGYRGEGPWGLHDLMIDAGFSEATASKVFVISRYAETTLIK